MDAPEPPPKHASRNRAFALRSASNTFSPAGLCKKSSSYWMPLGLSLRWTAGVLRTPPGAGGPRG